MFAGAAYDSSKAVKRLILGLTQKLDIAAKGSSSSDTRRSSSLSTEDIATACDAAKTLRNRILREHERVRKKLDKIKQQLYYGNEGASNSVRQVLGNDNDDEEADDGDIEGGGKLTESRLQAKIRLAVAQAASEDVSHQLYRSEFLFVGELQVLERIVIPALISHALPHAETLLPQFLKLVAAMTLPVPADAPDRTKQVDVLTSIRHRCSSDEFFLMLIHAVAPIASRRRDGPLSEGDAVLLEVVLNILTNLLRGSAASVEPIVGAMCRNHGVEMILVLLTQNYAKYEASLANIDNFTAEHILGRSQSRTHDDEVHESETTTGTNDRTLTTPDTTNIETGDVPDEAPRLAFESSEDIHRNETMLIVLPPEGATQQESVEGIMFSDKHSPCLEPSLEDEVLVLDDTQNAVDVSAFGEVVEVDMDHAVELEDGDDDDDDDDASSNQRDANVDVSGKQKVEEIDTESEPEVEEEEYEEEGDEGTDDGDNIESDEEDEEEGETDDLVILDEKIIRNDPTIQALAHDVQRDTLGNLRRWNNYILEIVALVFRFAPASDLSLLALALQSSKGGAASILSVSSLQQKLTAELTRQKKLDDSWRQVARGRSGALTTNSILIRRVPSSFVQHQNEKDSTWNDNRSSSIVAVGTVSTLMAGGRRQDPLGLVKEMDSRKKGRFHKKMLEPAKQVSLLPLPTQIHLSQQFATFLGHGFENLSTMMWTSIREQLNRLDTNVRDTVEVALASRMGREGPLLSALEDVNIEECLNYFFLCGTLLRFTRENLKHVVERRKESLARQPPQLAGTLVDESLYADPELDDLLTTFNTQWSAVAHIINLDHIQAGFTLLINFSVCKELSAEYDLTIPMHMVSELIALLLHLMEGDVAADPKVTMAAHAVGSSILYREENVKIVYRLIGDINLRQKPAPALIQSTVMLMHRLLSLIEKCSYDGMLAMPKAKPPQGRKKKGSAVDDAVDLDGVVEEGGNRMAAGYEEEEEERSEDDEYEEEAENASKGGDDGDQPMNLTIGKSPSDDGQEDGGIRSDPHVARVVEIDGDELVRQMLQQATNGTTTAAKGDDSAPLSGDLFSMHEELLPEDTLMDPRLTGEGLLLDMSPDDDNAAEGEQQPSANIGTEERPNVSDGTLLEPSSTGEGLLSSFHRSRSRESEEVASVMHSSHTGNTSLTSEREVKVQDFYLRLATSKNVPLLLYALQSWKTNDADVNLALVALLENFLSRSYCIHIVFNFPFLLVFHDIISFGKETHEPLYQIADRICFQFFNPSHVKSRHSLTTAPNGEVVLEDEDDGKGAMSIFGAEVALRCTRALFVMNATNYAILEEQGMPQHAPPVYDDNEVTQAKRKKNVITLPQDAEEGEAQSVRGRKKKRVRLLDDDERDAALEPNEAGTTAGRRRNRKAALADDGTGEVYVMNNADVTAVAKEVDRAERKRAAAAKKARKLAEKRAREDEKEATGRSSDDAKETKGKGDNSDAGDDDDIPLAQQFLKSSKSKHSSRHHNRDTDDDNDASDKKRRRREEKKHRHRSRDKKKHKHDDKQHHKTRHDAEVAAAADDTYLPGKVFVSDGLRYIVHDDGYAYLMDQPLDAHNEPPSTEADESVTQAGNHRQIIEPHAIETPPSQDFLV